MLRKLLFALLFCFGAYAAQGQKVGLVLSGGGAKGLYHIGVIRALEQNGIPIDYVSGTSMGAIVGALYCSGLTPDQIESVMTPEQVTSWLTGKIEGEYKYYFKQMDFDAAMVNLRRSRDSKNFLSAFLPSNLVSSSQLDMAFIKYFSAPTAASGGSFDNLFVPFRCVATDAVHRREVTFKRGDLGRAVRMSMTIPMLFKPIKQDSAVYYDGGLYNNFPWQPLKQDFNPDILIGSRCVDSNINPDDNASIMEQMFVITMLHTAYTLPDSTDIMIGRSFPDVSTLDFSKSKQIIQAGYDDTMADMTKIKARIARRVDTVDMEARREAFRQKQPPLLLGSYRIDGLTARQNVYVRKLLGLEHNNGSYSFDDFRLQYFKLLAEGEIESEYPEVNYNPSTGLFDMHLKMYTKPSFRIKVGGNISSTALNQAYIGLEFRNIGQSAYKYTFDGYFSPFYVSTAAAARIDFFMNRPFFFKGGASYNYYNYFRSDYGVLSKVSDLTYAKYEDSYASLALGMQMGRHSVMTMQGNAGIDNYRYHQNTGGSSKNDDLDRTKFAFVGAKFEIERNDLNFHMYPTRGIVQSLSAIFVSGNEQFYPADPATTPAEAQRTRTWVGAQFIREHYIPLPSARWFTLGYLLNATYTTHPSFNNAYVTNITSPAFTPTAHSKIVYMKEFRAPAFIGAGAIPIFSFNQNLYLRTSAYAFLPKNFVGEKMDVKDRLRFIFDSSLVYQTIIGPVSLSVSKYDTSKNNWFITFNFGYAIFNKKGLFY